MRAVELDTALEERIAAHLATARWADVPEPAREQAIRALLWWLGTALEGSTHPEQVPLQRYVTGQQIAGDALVIGTTYRTSPELAGFVNGSAGKIYEHEDKYWMDSSIGFALGCCVVPAALAAAEHRGGVTGHELLMAIALGLDLEIRLHRPLGMEFVPGRAISTSTFVFGNYGAAATAARIYGLDASGHLNALGLAHGQAAGNYEGHIEGRGVSAQAGFAVRNGVAAARLAAAGTVAARAPITGPAGLYAAHYRHATVDLADVTKDLGDTYWGADLAFKGYPCGIVAHPALDAARTIHAQLEGREVRSISVFGASSLSIMADPIELKRSPRTGIEAQFSIPWGVACVIRDGDLTIGHYDQSALADPELVRLASIVDISLGHDTVGSTVRAALSDDTVLAPPPVLVARGRPDNPLTTTEIIAVLTRAAERVHLREGAAERVVEIALAYDNLSEVRHLTQPLAAFSES